MNKLMILPTVRPEMFHNLLESIEQTPGMMDEWQMFVCFQCYSSVERNEILHKYNGFITGSIYSENRIAPYLCRAEIYRRTSYADVYLSLDDDMTFWPERTNFAPAVQKALEPMTGVVSCNWVRVNSPALIARARYEDRFIEQPLVNMSGGQVYTRKVARAALNYPVKNYLFCDIQLALVAYLEGYTNYRYLGSHLFHKVMAAGGLKTMFASENMALPDPTYLSVVPGEQLLTTDNNYHMPDSRLLTPAAHALHKQNQQKLLEKTYE